MAILDVLVQAHPALAICQGELQAAYDALVEVYKGDGKLLLCGNGGSAADAEHIAGELMKGFLKQRPLPPEERAALCDQGPLGERLAQRLQGALAAIPLTGQIALSTAFQNDVDPEMVFAQQAYALGRPGDALLGISTSGNARNVLYALHAAKARGLVTIGLTGLNGGAMNDVCDIVLHAPALETYRVQEYHLPLYHALCAMLEEAFFGG